MKKILTILILIFLSCDSPKSQETIEDWQLGPDEETLEPGVTYVREKGAELRFLEYKLDPREIAKKQVLPFREVFKDILKKKDFERLSSMTFNVEDEIGKKLGIDPYYAATDPRTPLEEWNKIYKKTGKDPYCDYDKLLKIKYEGIEMMPYFAENPKISTKMPNKIFYEVNYLVRINPNSNSPNSFFLDVSFDNITQDKYYYITSYNNHCPTPNLIPEVDIHDYHLKPE